MNTLPTGDGRVVRGYVLANTIGAVDWARLTGLKLGQTGVSGIETFRAESAIRSRATRYTVVNTAKVTLTNRERVVVLVRGS